MQLKDAEAKLLDLYAAKAGKTKAQAVPVGGTLLDLLISIITKCLGGGTSAKDIRTMPERHPIIASLRVRQEMRRSGLLLRPDATEIHDTILASAKDATDADVHDMAAEA